MSLEKMDDLFGFTRKEPVQTRSIDESSDKTSSDGKKDTIDKV